MNDKPSLSSKLRRALVMAGMGTAAGGALSLARAQTQTYPSKPIRWVVGFSAGGGLDFVARLLGDSISKQLGQPVVVDNRPGAAGMIAANNAATSPPDGYTLVTLDVGAYALNPNLYKNVSYNPTRDFEIIGLQVTIPTVLCVNATLPVNNLAEFIAYVKSKPPGSVSYASTGVGGAGHVAMELLMDKAKLDMSHVPYKGIQAALVDVMGGQVQAVFGDPGSSMPLVKSGKLKALAVAMSKRLEAYPELPTFMDFGYDFQIPVWVALATTAGTPRPIIDRLNAALLTSLKDPEITKKLVAVGFSISLLSPDEANAFAKKQLADWTTFLKPRNIKLD